MPIVLVVEDEHLIALWLAQVIADATCATVVMAATIGSAERHIAAGLDFAFLDVNLQTETTFGLARLLRTIDVPFAFTSGSNRNAVPDDLRSALFLYKPACTLDIVAAVVTGLSAGPRLH